MHKKFTIYCFILMMLSFCLYGCEKQKFHMLSCRLYINNNLYSGSPCLIENEDGDIGICYNLLEKELSYDNIEKVFVFNNEKYVYIFDLTEQYNVIVTENDIYIDDFDYKFDYSWTENIYVAHAMGGIDGYAYTNAYEAFLENYNKGHRVFEVDLAFTSDKKLVALHDWSSNTTINSCGFDLDENELDVPLSQERFMELKVNGRYTTLSLEDIINIMVDYPDVYFITDTKSVEETDNREIFQCIVDTANEIDNSVLDHFIPQIYNENMFAVIMDVYSWNSVIYTLYNQGINFSSKEVVDFAYKNGIRVITTYYQRSDDFFFEELYKRNIMVYMHTYNTAEEVDFFKNYKGVHGFYTDFLVP